MTNLMEAESGSANANAGEVAFHANPFEIVTVKVNVK